MMLRIMLVGLVASLGLELPSNADVETWARSGRNWASARMSELAAIQAEIQTPTANPDQADLPVEPSAPVVVTAPAPASSDLAFEAVADQVASDFKADLAMLTPAAPSAEMVARVEPTPAPATVEGTTASPEPVAVLESAETFSDEEEIAILTEVSPSRSERISAAVQMTYQAVNAWASALGTADEADTSR